MLLKNDVHGYSSKTPKMQGVCSIQKSQDLKVENIRDNMLVSDEKENSSKRAGGNVNIRSRWFKNQI